MPSGAELARVLAEESDYPDPGDPDLTWVAQYLVSVMGEMPLYELLHGVFEADYRPTSLHRLLARLPAILREFGERQLVVLTTNYDVLVERALEEAGEVFDVVWYEARRGEDRRFNHRLPDGEVVPIERPMEYDGLEVGERPVVVKLHGSVDRDDYEKGSYVLDEESYIRYLTGGPLNQLMPARLAARMNRSSFLFLGYSMRDWNIRAMLERSGRRQVPRSWAVQLEPPSKAAREITRQIWHNLGDINILNVPLREYVPRLADELDAAVLYERSRREPQ